jgi:hypothetical protein
MTPAQYRDALARLDLTQVAAARLLGINDRFSCASLLIPPTMALCGHGPPASQVVSHGAADFILTVHVSLSRGAALTKLYTAGWRRR